jgi:uncharacterized membrane protein YgcG
LILRRTERRRKLQNNNYLFNIHTQQNAIVSTMKQLLLGLSILVLALGTMHHTKAQSVQDFNVQSFDAYYEVNKQPNNVAAMRINEYIQAQFPVFDQNHGILRALPQTYNGSSLTLHILGVDASSLQSPSSEPWGYTATTQNGNTVLKIGYPNQFVHDIQNFHIRYTVDNVARKYAGYDEIFWNVNGTQWQQTMQRVSAHIVLPADIAAAVTNEVCYTGAAGSTAQNCTITKNTSNDGKMTVDVIANAALPPGENLSFAIAFKSGTFTLAKPSTWHQIEPFVGGAVGITITLVTLITCIRQWRKNGRDPKGRGTIVAEYVPPKDSTVLLQEFILHESGRPVAVTAQIINLAIRGYIRIIDTEKDALIGKKHSFALEKIKAFDGLSPEELQLTQMIFGDATAIGVKIELDDLKNSLSSEVTQLWKDVGNTATSAGYYTKNPAKATSAYIGFGIACIALGFGAFFLGGVFSTILALSLCISGIIVLITARYMPARTAKGVELHDYLLGLKQYIKVAEKDRIAFHQGLETAERQPINLNDPAQKVKLFEQLLPYAMLFGLEKDWANQFKDIYSAPPVWYGGTINNFSTGYLLGGLSGFNSAASTSFSPPASSGGSGFSGGSSGGGGGGGGGGGW